MPVSPAPVRRWLRALATVATVLAVGLTAAPSAAAAADPVTPGDFTGFAFDARCAPTSGQMDTWRTTSPFWGVGIYLGGSMMSCTEAEQAHLDESWVDRQSRRGWRVLPIWVGPQAACYKPGTEADRIDPERTDSYAAAGSQGAAEARAAVAEARTLGIPDDSTLWYDLESFDIGESDDCRRSALRFLSGWTLTVRELGYRSGVYSSVRAAIEALDYADGVSPGSYEMPDQVWFAWANDRADTYIRPDWVRADSWLPGGRMHQYALDEWTTYGGVTLRIDRNFLDLGRGSVAPAPPASCGVLIDYADYVRLARGSRGGQVQALQCLLRQRGSYGGPVDGRFDRPVARAVRSYQADRGLPVTGTVNARTWTALLAHGSSPVLKRGSADNAVRRLQRALNVATRADLPVNGVFGASTTRWTRVYQDAVGVPVTGVVAGGTWRQLHLGRR